MRRIDPTNPTHWVLDLRVIPTSAPRPEGSHINTTGPTGMRITNATAVGEVAGYSIEAQRRSRSGYKGTCIRLTAPDGRVLDLIGWLSDTDTNARGPVGNILSRTVSSAFSESATEAQRQEAGQRIEAVIETGHECLREGVLGSQALALVQCAANGLPVETYAQWADAFPDPDLDRIHASIREETGITPPVRVSALYASEITHLTNAGFTPDTAREWFGDRPFVRTKSEAEATAALREHGWTPEQARDLRRRFAAPTSWKAWAAVGPDRYDLALRAGLTPAAAKRLLRRGTWDEATLETLAALRN